MTKQAILVMAYGTPADIDDVERYYTDIRHGRPPAPELLKELKQRYEAIGGRSPLLEITRAQTKGLEERLGVRAYLGQKHSPPFIADAVGQAAADGVDELVGLVLAPHFSTMSIGDYERRAQKAAADAGWQGRLSMIDSWHLEPGYIDFLVHEVRRSLDSLPGDARGDALVVFSAHSLPQRILKEGDPYPEQLMATGEAVAAAASLTRWRTGWQSAGRTADPWLGPDILEIVGSEADAGTAAIVVCPCGFVADHLEVLYDLDIEAAAAAAARGVALTRTRAPNDDPAFLDALAAVVSRALAAPV